MRVFQYLGESSVFEYHLDGSCTRMLDDEWYYKVFADDQVGWIMGEQCRLHTISKPKSNSCKKSKKGKNPKDILTLER